jgi:hypothetical protein
LSIGLPEHGLKLPDEHTTSLKKISEEFCRRIQLFTRFSHSTGIAKQAQKLGTAIAKQAPGLGTGIAILQ